MIADAIPAQGVVFRVVGRAAPIGWPHLFPVARRLEYVSLAIVNQQD